FLPKILRKIVRAL
nr:Chain A, Crabrolin Plus, mutant of Crabrolin peptide [Vespa crabro]